MAVHAEVMRDLTHQADLSAEKIFYTDDLKANVQGATEEGIDAVLYTDTATLSDALRQRGLEFNF